MTAHGNNGDNSIHVIADPQGNQNVEFVNTELPDVIELKGVRQKYGEKLVIDDCNLLIEDHPNTGQFITILGASGCGKTTILNYIAGLQKPTSGEVLINSRPIELADPISMVFQKYSSFPWLSVLGNVMLPLILKGVSKKEAREKAHEMIDKVGLDGHEQKFAQDHILSGGQLQRVAIARSLISNPRIILMDEPFGALDTNTRFDMQIMLSEIWLMLKSTIILVTHDISEAVFLSDDIFFMSANPGKIVDYYKVDLPLERPRELKHSAEFFRIRNEVEDTLYAIRQKQREEERRQKEAARAAKKTAAESVGKK